MKINHILGEDGIIVPGVNTTVDVKPGQTEKEAAKFFGHGKPKELHAKARKNSDPNTLYNMGLAETSKGKKDTIKPRDPSWRDMEALRRSGAAGSHKDKKRDSKNPRKAKHKGNLE